jgi:hypothetical protein
MQMITTWTGGYGDILRRAMQMTYEEFAGYLRVSPRQVKNWHARPEIAPQPKVQRILNKALDDAPERVKARFALLVSEVNRNAADAAERLSIPLDAMTSREWNCNDARLLANNPQLQFGLQFAPA